MERGERKLEADELLRLRRRCCASAEADGEDALGAAEARSEVGSGGGLVVESG
jgi:hypothetical protein